MTAIATDPAFVTVDHASADYLEQVVPLSKRDSPLKMGLLWVTFIASVSNVITGFLARSDDMTLGNLFTACAIAIPIMVGYGVLAAYLGSETGQAHSVLTRGILGRTGSGLASIALLITGLGWYGFQAYFLGVLLQGLFPNGFWGSLFGHHLVLWSFAFGLLMVCNNLLGFRGLAKYARMVAAPILLAWGIYTIIKAFSSTAGHHLFASPHLPVASGILITVELLLGSALYGNEPDIFRYSQRGKTKNLLPLAFGYAMGIGIFPVAGYLMAELSNASGLPATVHFMLHYSLFGLTFVALLLFLSNQVALNDANLYEGVNAIQNLLKGRYRIPTVLGLGLVGASLAAYMAHAVSLQNNFFIVANMTAVFLPCATLVMATDLLLLKKIAGVDRPKGPEGSRRAVVAWADSSWGSIVGVVAILGGFAVGAVTGGLIPGTRDFGKVNIGIPGVEAWATALGIYFIGMLIARALPRYRAVLLGLPRSLSAKGEEEFLLPNDEFLVASFGNEEAGSVMAANPARSVPTTSMSTDAQAPE